MPAKKQPEATTEAQVEIPKVTEPKKKPEVKLKANEKVTKNGNTITTS